MTSPSPSGTPSSNRNVMLVLAYLGPLAVIPLVVEKDDREVQWHAKHGVVLFVGELILMVGVQLVLIALGGFLSCLGMVFTPVFMLAFFLLHVYAIVKALNGQRLIIPGVSEFVDRF